MCQRMLEARFFVGNSARKRCKGKWEDLKASGEETLRKVLWLISPHHKHKLSLGEFEALGVKGIITTTSFKLSPNLTRFTEKSPLKT